MVLTGTMHSINDEQPSIIDHKILEGRVKKLEKLCQEVDPFTPLSDELRNELAMFGIVNWRDPDHLTKQIILMFEDSVRELRSMTTSNMQ